MHFPRFRLISNNFDYLFKTTSSLMNAATTKKNTVAVSSHPNCFALIFHLIEWNSASTDNKSKSFLYAFISWQYVFHLLTQWHTETYLKEAPLAIIKATTPPTYSPQLYTWNIFAPSVSVNLALRMSLILDRSNFLGRAKNLAHLGNNMVRVSIGDISRPRALLNLIH